MRSFVGTSLCVTISLDGRQSLRGEEVVSTENMYRKTIRPGLMHKGCAGEGLDPQIEYGLIGEIRFYRRV